jgi:hypothetical protein
MYQCTTTYRYHDENITFGCKKKYVGGMIVVGYNQWRRREGEEYWNR